jgi:hypothetical protein
VAAGFAGLIASGQYGAAEQQIEQLLQRFSVSRASKLLSMHHLAALRHAQRRFGDAAALCRELLGQRLGHLKGLSRASRLILADSLLELNDPVSAYHAMVPLYQQRLPLGEALALLSIQLDYQARTGAWAAITEQIATKVQLTELMPPGPAVRAQALLAVAAQRCGKDDWSRWLIQRVELQSDVQELCARRPMLWELWSRPSA